MARPKKKTIVKKSNQAKILKSNFSTYKPAIFGAIIVIFVLGIFVLGKYNILEPYSSLPKPQYSKVGPMVLSAESSPASEEALNLATPTPSASPSPTPSPIPYQALINYGRSVDVPILYYHYIGNNPNPADTARDSLSIVPDLFEQEMKYISENGYNTITFDELYAALNGTATLPPKPVLLSFDDGYVDFFVNAFPILQQYHLKATSFIPTGLMDQGYYLKWAQILQMKQSGLISFEAHSVSHPNLPSLSDAQLHYEVFSSKQVLQDKIGQPVNFFAYPYGTNDARVQQVVKDAGFLAAVGTWYGKVETQGTEYDLPRVRMGGNVSMQQFINNISQ